MHALVLCHDEEELLAGVRGRFGEDVRVIHLHPIDRLPFVARKTYRVATSYACYGRSWLAEHVFWPSVLKPMRGAVRDISDGDVLCLGNAREWCPLRTLPGGGTDDLYNIRPPLILRFLDRYLPPKAFFVVGYVSPEQNQEVDPTLRRPGRFDCTLTLDQFIDSGMLIRPHFSKTPSTHVRAIA